METFKKWEKLEIKGDTYSPRTGYLSNKIISF